MTCGRVNWEHKVQHVDSGLYAPLQAVEILGSRPATALNSVIELNALFVHVFPDNNSIQTANTFWSLFKGSLPIEI